MDMLISTDRLVLVVLVALVVLMVVQLIGQQRLAAELRTELRDVRDEMHDVRDDVRVQTGQLSDKMKALVKDATITIVDTNGDPIACAFFVSPCGVALTANHNSQLWVNNGKPPFVNARNFKDEPLRFHVVAHLMKTKHKLDVAVLRLTKPPSSPLLFLPLPETPITEFALLNSPVVLVHSSIALCKDQAPPGHKLGVTPGHITTVMDSASFYYAMVVYKGDSGAAVLLRGDNLIGLHAEGFNDLDDAHSESSVMTTGIAVRMDNPDIIAVVKRAKKTKGS